MPESGRFPKPNKLQRLALFAASNPVPVKRDQQAAGLFPAARSIVMTGRNGIVSRLIFAAVLLCVGMSDIVDRLEKSGTRINLVLLDACRDNPFSGQCAHSTSGGLAQMPAPVGTLISFATQPRSVSLDGIDGHSPYTRALVGPAPGCSRPSTKSGWRWRKRPRASRYHGCRRRRSRAISISPASPVQAGIAPIPGKMILTFPR